MKKTLLFSVLPLLFAACQQNASPTAQASCIDKSKINPDAICTMEYAPVCGCDGKVYSNACVATKAGVTSFTQGECK